MGSTPLVPWELLAWPTPTTGPRSGGLFSLASHPRQDAAGARNDPGGPLGTGEADSRILGLLTRPRMPVSVVASHWCGVPFPKPATYPNTAPPLCESRRRIRGNPEVRVG